MNSVARAAVCCLAGIGSGLFAVPARPAEEPLWELGVGVAPLTFPAYRGSDNQRTFVFPIPYIVYRGDRLKVDRDGARGLLLDTERYELDVSLDGAIPVDSTDEGPRAGMEELDPVVEIGPSLKVRLSESETGVLDFRVPVRAAIAVGDGLHQEGWKVQPKLNFDAPRLIGGWDVGFSIGPKFASRGYHAYYYDVGPADVTPTRPAYDAGGGYSGLGLMISARQRFDRVWVGSFVGYDYLDGAVFDDSPLVETDHAVRAGIAISWVLWQSEETVTVDPGDVATGR